MRIIPAILIFTLGYAAMPILGVIIFMMALFAILLSITGHSKDAEEIFSTISNILTYPARAASDYYSNSYTVGTIEEEPSQPITHQAKDNLKPEAHRVTPTDTYKPVLSEEGHILFF